ncbi:metal ABC transporter permease [Nitratifractor salsuginis]|uniref:ABC-3 protein n=1 Tax=Nitratifractor salsuginis (strain DSM 16511 / JCM 12458 / E9I37-1) TaxID=749222 RepID=E6X1F8_NITSE|nr:metal ABC transporter permease [Nitratifractor salsuginis]ADV45891.1 ABC-3 protein [Nitratifractor salsuginis DSM 16511]
MTEIFHYTFMQNALLAGILVSLAAGIIGSLIVVNRLVFLTGGIAHSSYGGIGLAIYFSLPIFLGASLFTIATALLLAWLTFRRRHLSDTYIGMIWAVGMALGVIFVDLTPGYNVDLMSYLFGSILAVEHRDLWFMGLLLLGVLFFVHRWYRELLAISYDSEYAELRGIPSSRFYTLLLILSALTVVAAIKVVGLILVIALMTIPTHIAQHHSSTLYGMMIRSALLAALFTLAGLWLSYRYDLTSGACIILVGATGLIADALYRRFGPKAA